MDHTVLTKTCIIKVHRDSCLLRPGSRFAGEKELSYYHPDTIGLPTAAGVSAPVDSPREIWYFEPGKL